MNGYSDKKAMLLLIGNKFILANNSNISKIIFQADFFLILQSLKSNFQVSISELYSYKCLRILTGKTHSQMKLTCFTKDMNMDIWIFGT